MEFNEYIRTKDDVFWGSVQCPLCGARFTGADVFVHLRREHGVDSTCCGCRHGPMDWSWQQNIDHFRTFDDPAQHARDMAVMWSLETGGMWDMT